MTIPVTIRPSDGPCEAGFEIETTLPTLRLGTRMVPEPCHARAAGARR